MTGVVADNLFKNKAKEIATKLGIVVETMEEFYSHNINGHVVEKRYKVNGELNIIVDQEILYKGERK
jgi:hypothetical protein